MDWLRAARTDREALSRLADHWRKIFYDTHFALLLQMHGVVNEVALEIQCNGERTIPTLVSAVQKRDAAGTPLRNRITVFDATERRRYEQELLIARKRAEETAGDLSRVNSELVRSNAALLDANEELGQIAYVASHDLQEPLRTMTLYTQLLAQRFDGVLDSEAKGLIETIVDGSRRMQVLIGDLLAFSQAQGSPLVLRPTDMEQTLAVTRSNLRYAIEESNATITNDKLPFLTIDAARIAQVLQNLIANAIKYRSSDKAPVVHICARKENSSEWVITVEDNGLGFESVFSEQIFRMFKRLHGQEIPGTGIGLAICKKIIESHGGRIWATSKPGAGSCFSFTIPDRVSS